MRLPANLRHGRLRDAILERPPESLNHEVKQWQQDKRDQEKDLFKRGIFHHCLSYFLWVADGSFPVLAIASRIPVSACTFFIL